MCQSLASHYPNIEQLSNKCCELAVVNYYLRVVSWGRRQDEDIGSEKVITLLKATTEKKDKREYRSDK